MIVCAEVAPTVNVSSKLQQVVFTHANPDPVEDKNCPAEPFDPLVSVISPGLINPLIVILAFAPVAEFPRSNTSCKV